MPSGSTLPRAKRASVARGPMSRLRGRWGRSSGALLLLLAGSILLAACSSGNVRDANLAATRDATRPSILGSFEETRVATSYFGPEGTPEPLPTTLPTLEQITLATSVNGDGSPNNTVASVSEGTFYVSANVFDLHEGQVATAILGAVTGEELTRSEIRVERDTESRWLSFEFNGSDLNVGEYAVFIYVDSELLNSLVFSRK